MVHFAFPAPMESVIQRRGIKAKRDGGKNLFTLRELDMLFCEKLIRNSQPTFTEGVGKGEEDTLPVLFQNNKS